MPGNTKNARTGHRGALKWMEYRLAHITLWWASREKVDYCRCHSPGLPRRPLLNHRPCEPIYSNIQPAREETIWLPISRARAPDSYITVTQLPFEHQQFKSNLLFQCQRQHRWLKNLLSSVLPISESYFKLPLRGPLLAHLLKLFSTPAWPSCMSYLKAPRDSPISKHLHFTSAVFLIAK